MRVARSRSVHATKLAAQSEMLKAILQNASQSVN